MKYFSFFIFVFIPLLAFAHGGGQTLRQEAGDYVLHLDTVSSEVVSGNAERLNVEIERTTGTEVVAFSDVWVRIISPSGAFLFSGNLANKAPVGLATGISFLFPIAGTYDITARFLGDGKTIAEASFALPVAEGKRAPGTTADVMDQTPYQLGFAAVLLLGGFLVGRLLALLRSKPKS